ncbi:MAG: 4-hydroxy-tetrahydrodipicolinate reductase [Brachybacterium sp.]|uniref:4-hydroxy-tetrahydrodipicolinate reductase n=1 Tax=Brachybacterium sp. TaxID=1891286 RepID=UPI00264C325B|nr:4-hydroxy-tetrahydrodipicolinate reductase [Brachybacterium sp.]MDN6303375.1 4-hydroxy-tetrahydrodipicolinate reductase [Brachybacterium sp.]MDN6327742.1 4-hydroxy-tetrahydrodipicolinate reductase [Brachybacterium sp.]MDN6400406.1 4-hydroxy-tetrahydrodipicolinate reductase [Brachybacterium sp.]
MTQSSSRPTRVAVLGASGRMGAAACAAVEEAQDLELVARIGRDDPLDAVAEAGAEVAIDLTIPSATGENVRWLVEHGIHAVVGTTGWTEEGLGELRTQLAGADGIGVLIAPNFAIGAVLTMRFAEIAARYYESAEIIEMHHPNKLDAPSGTATHTAAAIARGREAGGLGPVPDATEKDPAGARGAVVDGIHVHAVRQRGLVAHEVVQFGGVGEQFMLRHDSFDRISFMPGVLLGVREVGSRPGLTVGLDGYMDLG